MAVQSHPRQSASVADATSVIEARRRALVKSRVIRVLIAIVALAIAVFAIWAIWFSPMFVTRSVEVTGNSQASTDEILQAAQIDMGIPLVGVDTAAVRTRVLDVPAVADATVSRHLSGVITISVTERVAVYTMSDSNRFLLVDATGKGYLTVDSQPAGLPVVKLSPELSTQDRLMADAAQIVQALPVSVTSQMLSLSATSPDTFTIALGSGATIMWGSADQSGLKASVIDGLLNVPASYYDVSSPSHPATR